MLPAAGPVARLPMLLRCRPAPPRQWIQALLRVRHPVNHQVCLHRRLRASFRARSPAAARVCLQVTLHPRHHRRLLALCRLLPPVLLRARCRLSIPALHQVRRLLRTLAVSQVQDPPQTPAAHQAPRLLMILLVAHRRPQAQCRVHRRRWFLLSVHRASRLL